MDPIRRKLSSFLTEAAQQTINALEPKSSCAKQLSEIGDVEAVLAEEIGKICEAATMTEITKILFLAARLKTTSGQKKEVATNNLKRAAEALITRVENESGPLKIPQSCRLILLGI